VATSIGDVKQIESQQAGDRAAFVEAFRAYQPALFRQAMRSLHDWAAAEDAVQETFARAFRSFHRIDGEWHLGPWLHRIMANVCIDEANRRRREADKVERAVAKSEFAQLSPGVEDQLGLGLDDADLHAALDRLPADYRQALSLRFVHELPYDEVAQASGVSEQNARARVSRARQAMRVALRGVAALPLLALAGLRRGQRAASAFEGAEPSRLGSSAALGTAQAGHLTQAAQTAGGLSSMVDTASALVSTTPQAVPLLAKAAVGIGAVAMAVMPSSTPESFRAAAPSSSPPASAPAVEEPSAPEPSVPAVAVAGDTSAPDGTSASSLVEPTVAELPAVDELGVSVLPVESSAPPVASVAPPTTLAAVVEPPPVTSSDPPAVDPTEPPAPSVPLVGGSLTAGSVEVVPAGPRFDVSGSVSVTVDGVTHTGWLSGRVAVDAEADPDGLRRFSGTLTISLDDAGTIDLRLAGRAGGEDPGDGTVPSWLSVSGQYRASGSSLPLAPAGSFAGSVAVVSGGSWSLDLSA
jgi:RNA polymerase sigma-70 factor (ECF subfamily)